MSFYQTPSVAMGRGGNPAGQRHFECNGAKMYAADELVQNNSGATLFSSHWFRGSLGALAERGEKHQEMAVYVSHSIPDRGKNGCYPVHISSWEKNMKNENYPGPKRVNDCSEHKGNALSMGYKVKKISTLGSLSQSNSMETQHCKIHVACVL